MDRPANQNRPTVDAVLARISDGYYSVNSAWQFTDVNRQALQILACSAEDLLGKDLWEVFPGLRGSVFEEGYRRVMLQREPEELKAFYPDHQRWYEVQAYPTDDGLSVYFRNVTDIVNVDAKLKQSEQRLQKMADSIPQIVWICDAQWNAQYINQKWSDFTGFPFDALLVQDQISAILHEDDRDATLCAWERSRSDGRAFYAEHRMKSASGEYRWFMARAQPEIDPETRQILGWFGTSTDIHEQKLAQMALEISEARYNSLFNSIDEGFCVIEMLFDPAGNPVDYRFVDVNPVFEQQTGLHDVIGKTVKQMVPQHESYWYEIYGDVALTGQPVRFENEAKALQRWYDVYAFRIDAPEDRHVAVLFKDITERKVTERQLLLDSQRKDEFLAMLAHELRNPLAPISAAADLLRLAQPDDARVRKSSEIISRQVRHMTSLINDLLDVSRVTSGLVSLDSAATDLRQILLEAQEQTRPLIESRRHHFSSTMPSEAMIVRGDSKRLIQIFSNLLNNAAKYTPEGGIISLRGEVRENEVDIVVADNGIGMSPSLVKNAFELFTQAERTADRAQGGLGIGLALVKSLVELHGGRVVGSSAGLNEGSEFRVTLPLMVSHAVHVPLGDDPTHNALEPLRLMVVDDNEDAARMLAMFLEAAGHEVIVEFESRRALERAAIERPSVCLLDVGLPDIDGYELARRLKRNPDTADMTLIAITGYGQEKDRLNTAQAGFSHHFVKPVSTDALMTLLTEIAVSRQPG